MSHHKLYSEFMSVVQDEVFIRYSFYKLFFAPYTSRTSYPSLDTPNKTDYPIIRIWFSGGRVLLYGLVLDTRHKLTGKLNIHVVT